MLSFPFSYVEIRTLSSLPEEKDFTAK
jgi:hypothetical protein